MLLNIDLTSPAKCVAATTLQTMVGCPHPLIPGQILACALHCYAPTFQHICPLHQSQSSIEILLDKQN